MLFIEGSKIELLIITLLAEVGRLALEILEDLLTGGRIFDLFVISLSDEAGETQGDAFVLLYGAD